jgi:deazaflavin-dependent oxidoreductase (nitroreductase family)
MIDTVETRSQHTMACNARFIAEFRANAGKVGGRFAQGTFLLLHTTGARTGRERLTPLAYLACGCRYYVFAAGPFLRRHPSWYFNLVAQPDVTIEIGGETAAATARVLTGNDRERIYQLVVAEIPQLPQWQREAGREFPIVELTRK